MAWQSSAGMQPVIFICDRSVKLFANFLALSALILAAPMVRADELDTDHMFSFNAGSDIGDPGEKEIQAGFSGRFGKASGTYSALTPELSFQTTPMPNLEIGVAASASHYTVGKVPGLVNRNTTAFNELSFGLAYRLLDRAAKRRIPIVIVNRGATKGDARADVKLDAGTSEVLTAMVERLVH